MMRSIRVQWCVSGSFMFSWFLQVEAAGVLRIRSAAHRLLVSDGKEFVTRIDASGTSRGDHPSPVNIRSMMRKEPRAKLPPWLLSSGNHSASKETTSFNRVHLLSRLALSFLHREKGATVRHSSHADGVSVALPGLDVFNHRFQQNFADAKDMEPLSDPGSVKLLVGILTITTDKEYRNVHRGTWMKKPGVCKVDLRYDTSPPSNCKLYVTFVAGQSNETRSEFNAEAQSMHDITQLSFDATRIDVSHHLDGFQVVNGRAEILDSLNASDAKLQGTWMVLMKYKQLLWVRFAQEHYKWATHVATMDIDTYPFTQFILRDFLVTAAGLFDMRDRDRQLVKMPANWSERHGGMYYGANCGGGFKHGAFFAHSRSLIDCMFQHPNLNFSFDVGSDLQNSDEIMHLWVSLVTKDHGGEKILQEQPDLAPGICPEPWRYGPTAGCGWPSHWTHYR